jgi:hypothetical protein
LLSMNCPNAFSMMSKIFRKEIKLARGIISKFSFKLKDLLLMNFLFRIELLLPQRI